MSAVEIGLPEALERAASALPQIADTIRPANGDPHQLARSLGGADATQVLSWLLHHEPAAGAELALAWAEDPETADVVLGLSPDSLPKPAGKALRRALHRLRSRGVALPAAPASATVATLAPIDDAVDEARITAFDPHGVRLAYLATDHPAGGVRLFELALDEAHGVLQFDVFEAGRSRARRFLREAERREHWPAVAAPSASVRALIARAVAQQPANRTPPRHFAEWRSRLCDVAPDVATPGVLAREALGVDADAALEIVVGWVRAGSVGPWPPPIERVRSLLDRLDEIARGRILVSESASSEQVDGALEEAQSEIYDATVRASTAHRFEETAFVWWKSAREADARLALAAAAAFRSDSAGGRRIARAMLEVVLAPALERARKQKGAGSTREPSAAVEA